MLPENEQERLQALRDYLVLDTPPSDQFDRLTELATQVFEVPTSMIALIDANRQWFKSKVNLGLVETPRVMAFCAHTILQGRPMVIEDALADQRFKDNPLVTGAPHVRFYAGAPMRTAAGHSIGTFALVDYRPRQFSEKQQHLLEILAATALSELELWRRLQTERQQQQRSQERRFRALIENARDMVQLLDADGRVLYVSPSVKPSLGYEPEEYAKRSVFSLLPPEDVERTKRVLAEVVAQPGCVRELAGTYVDSAGQRRSFEATAQNLLHDPDVRAIVVNSRDVTARERSLAELRRAAARLQQSEKMEALGQLAGGIAHDFNNVLTVMLASAGSLAAMIANDHPACEEVVAIRDAAQHAAQLTQHILAFSRGQALRRTPLDVNQHVEHALELMARMLGNVVIDFQPGERLPLVRADATQVEQVIFNLCINARDAMGGAGRLTVRTCKELIDEQRAASQPGAQPGEYVVIQISDTGVGMAPEVLEHAFEPFFTAKTGSGTGLGLSSVYGIVKQHGGFVTVRSAPGEGSTFCVHLPLKAALRASDPPPASELSGNDLIMVVDDDAAIRRTASRVLRAAGYRVVTADDGDHAVQLFESHEERFALVILDVRMPRLNGIAALRQIRARDAGVAVILSTGYVGGADLDEASEQHVTILRKPYDDATLVAAVRSTLGAQASP